MDRRDFLKTVGLAGAGAIFVNRWPFAGEATRNPPDGLPIVYFTRDTGAESLKKLYARVDQGITGKTALKVHTGEPHGPNIIPPAVVREFMTVVPNATIVECNVFYASPRQTTEEHREVLKTNGWTFAPVDIMDADGDIDLPVPGGKHYRTVAMGRNIVNYDSMVVLTHFKGHTMGGFGGSLKNIAIGCASGKVGKRQLHQAGDNMWGHTQERFMENMAESGKAILAHFGPRMAFINVMNKMSVDCDCAGRSAAPVVTPDVGALASTDLLAVDQASVDRIYALPPDDRRHLVERIESRKGLRQLSRMEEMGMGSRKYRWVDIT